LSTQSGNLSKRLLLGLMRHQLAVVSSSEAERNISAKIQPASLLVCLHLSNALSDAISLISQALAEPSFDRHAVRAFERFPRFAVPEEC